MSLVSLQWDREYNTTKKVPNDWHKIFDVSTPSYMMKLFSIANYFAPESISMNIKHTFMYPVAKTHKKYPHLRINSNIYWYNATAIAKELFI